MTAPSRLGIVTVTYNSAQVLPGFMASVLAQTYPDWRLYAIDNLSADDTLAELARSTDERVVVIPNTENCGVAAGNNQGIRAALHDGCTYVLLLNNDTEFGAALAERLVTDLEESGCDMLTPKIMYYDAPNRVWCAGGEFRPCRGYATRHYGQREIDHGQYDTPRDIQYAPTCCLLIRRSVFDKVGLMDETYFVYFDDADFCLRGARAGLRLRYTPRATVLHKDSSLTGGVASAFTLRYSVRNKLYFLKKHLGLQWWAWAILYQGYLWARWLGRRDSWREFQLRQQSFGAGLRLNILGQR